MLVSSSLIPYPSFLKSVTKKPNHKFLWTFRRQAPMPLMPGFALPKENAKGGDDKGEDDKGDEEEDAALTSLINENDNYKDEVIKYLKSVFSQKIKIRHNEAVILVKVIQHYYIISLHKHSILCLLYKCIH